MPHHVLERRLSPNSEFIVPTKTKCWVVPCNGEFIKLLFKEQDIKISDLSFESSEQSRCFVRTLFLLALKDECLTQSPSPLAEFARTLVDRLANQDQ